MSLEERLEQAEKLVADVKAELAAMRATKRNWPERIEAGMCFERNGGTYIATTDRSLLCIHGINAFIGNIYSLHGYFGSVEGEFAYLGHARDILAIRTDAHEPVEGIDEQRQKYANASEYYAAARAPKAHEPTGAELVGKVCEFSDSPIGPWSPGLCAAFGHNPTYQYRKAGGAEWRYARLAK